MEYRNLCDESVVRLHKKRGVLKKERLFFCAENPKNQGVEKIVILPIAGAAAGAYNGNGSLLVQKKHFGSRSFCRSCFPKKQMRF